MGVDVMSLGAKLIGVKNAGVAGPTRVINNVAQNSVSIASTAAAMGALVVGLPEKEAVGSMCGSTPGMM